MLKIILALKIQITMTLTDKIYLKNHTSNSLSTNKPYLLNDNCLHNMSIVNAENRLHGFIIIENKSCYRRGTGQTTNL